jgi:glycosyltransferase involved in cell wall biosynthesis
MAESADKIITVSNAMKDYISSLGYPYDRISTVWNGVDPDKYSSDSVSIREIETLRNFYGIQSDEKVILFVGRLTLIKGVQNLLQAMPQVISIFPKTHLVILGVGGEYSDLARLTTELEIVENITFRTEFVSEHEKIVHYAMSDVCVFPSITEPFGIVCLEAMAMGKPVVVGAKGVNGFREQVIPSGPDRTGVHVNAEDPQDIAWGLCESLANPYEARKWGENGVKRVRRYFTWKAVAENTVNIYKEAIENTRQRLNN